MEPGACFKWTRLADFCLHVSDVSDATYQGELSRLREGLEMKLEEWGHSLRTFQVEVQSHMDSIWNTMYEHVIIYGFIWIWVVIMAFKMPLIASRWSFR